MHGSCGTRLARVSIYAEVSRASASLLSSFQNVGDALARETEIKKWRREKKVALIHADNPTWEDLAVEWGGAAVMRVSGKAGSSLRSE